MSSVRFDPPAGEREPLLYPQQESSRKVNFQPAPLTKDDLEVPPSNEKDTKKLKEFPTPPGLKAGIGIMLFITFLSSVCFSIVLPSVWPYIQHIEAKLGHVAVKSQSGWVVAINSAGSFVASPLIGYWGDRRTARESLAGTLVLMIVGNVMYSLSVNYYMLLAARFVVGVACANYCVAQTYISYATTVENRTLVMALNSASNVLGFIVGPALAMLLNLINFDVYGLEINSMTSPGYVAALFSLAGLLSLFFLVEVPASFKRNKNKPLTGGSTAGSGFYSGQGSIKDISMILKMGKNKKIPHFPVIVCLFAYFAFTASFTTFETIGTIYTQEAYNWGTSTNGILYAVLGVECVLGLMVLQIFLKLANERTVLLGTVLMSIGGFGILLNFHGTQLVGLVRFCAGASLASVSYATGSSILLSIYSKILEPFDQGAMMGWMSSAGSFSRIIGPIVAGYTYQHLGPVWIFVEILGLTIISFILLSSAYRRLVVQTPIPLAKHVNPV